MYNAISQTCPVRNVCTNSLKLPVGKGLFKAIAYYMRIGL